MLTFTADKDAPKLFTQAEVEDVKLTARRDALEEAIKIAASHGPTKWIIRVGSDAEQIQDALQRLHDTSPSADSGPRSTT